MRPPNRQLKKKTAFLLKPKVLVIGDSVAHNAEFANIERATQSRIRSVKAYSSVHDKQARWPQMNFKDVTVAALLNHHVDDEYTQLVF